jgi:hypothetical protein
MPGIVPQIFGEKIMTKTKKGAEEILFPEN